MKLTRYVFPLMALALSACTNVEVATKESPTDSIAAPAPNSATARAAVRFAPVKNIDSYKEQVARRIVEADTRAFSGELPPILKSIVVLELTFDREGQATRATVTRSNGFKDLEKIALESVKSGGAFPAPTRTVLAGRNNVRYLETWLFREDGKFQIRSLVTKGQPGAEKIALAQGVELQ